MREWDRWMRAVGEFYDYRDTDGFGRVYQVHRRSIMPAMRVCQEWVAPPGREDRGGVREPGVHGLAGLAPIDHGILGGAQETVVRAFELGTGTFAVGMDVGRRLVRVRHS